ncbi:CGGC domain protein [Peptococcaceae bacterium CEB3]|nr:CGGC domain protein [Peptococcaceae bacterium CEB3]
MARRIGILGCSNVTQEYDCAFGLCMRDLRKRQGEFSRYPKDEKLELIGIVNCAGCPTVRAPEKILHKVRALAEMNVDAIHLTFCMVSLCPFVKMYVDVIEEAYPMVSVVYGTHDPRVSSERFQEEVKGLFCAPRMTMTDVIFSRPGGKRSVQR